MTFDALIFSPPLLSFFCFIHCIRYYYNPSAAVLASALPAAHQTSRPPHPPPKADTAGPMLSAGTTFSVSTPVGTTLPVLITLSSFSRTVLTPNFFTWMILGRLSHPKKIFHTSHSVLIKALLTGELHQGRLLRLRSSVSHSAHQHPSH